MGFHEYDDEAEAAGEPHPMDDADELNDLLLEKGFVTGESLLYFPDWDGAHDEWSWGSRMGDVLTFLFGHDDD